MKPNFYVQDTKVYDPQGNEILEDEDGIVIVEVDGVFKPYVRSILVRWLANNPDIPQAKIPKAKRIPSQFEAMHGIEEKPKPVKPKKQMGRPRFRPRDENGNLIKPAPKGRKRLPRDENGRRLDKPKKTTTQGPPGKKVLCVTTGVEYGSIYRAGKELGINLACIRNCLEGKWRETKGYQFQFA